MTTSDPTLVDTPTLIRSAKRDLFEAQQRCRQAFDWLAEAQVTLAELERRANSDPNPGQRT
jgi:hypothetical protein